MVKIYRLIQISEPVSLRKCPYDHWLTKKAYLSAVTVTNPRVFTNKMAAKINWHRDETKLRHCRAIYTHRRHSLHLVDYMTNIKVALTGPLKRKENLQQSVYKWTNYTYDSLRFAETQTVGWDQQFGNLYAKREVALNSGLRPTKVSNQITFAL